jgi:hypothetical protein
MKFHNFSFFVNENSKIFCSISVSSELWKFWPRNIKAMAKDKKVKITVIDFESPLD